jgi:WD40 repeat protein
MAENSTTVDSPVPIKTIFDIHAGRGVMCLDISGDSKYLVTLGADSPQTISVWEWAQPSSNMLKQTFIMQKDLVVG